MLLAEPFEGHYQNWGYSIGYEMDQSGQPVPEDGNTAIFRILPHGMTEPVFVTKPEEGSTFTIGVLSGEGELIRARANGEVEQLPLAQGSEVTIHTGEAYMYRNTDKRRDLVLHDVALPAFKPGDDVELTSSYRAAKPTELKDGYLSCLAITPDSEFVKVDLPAKFYELVGQALRGGTPDRETAERNSNVTFDLVMAAGGLAMLGVGLYANYSAITGKHNGFDLLSWPSGLTTGGALFSYSGIKGLAVSIWQGLAARSRDRQ